MNAGNKIRILIADDHSVVRLGLITLIERQRDMEIVAEAEDGNQAVDQVRKHRPDIVLLDLRMPHMGGVQAAEVIAKEFPKSRIIVLTTYDGDEDIYRALKAGAKGYLLKDVNGPELLDTIRQVAAGRTRIPSRVAERLAQRIPLSELTPREMEILTLIVRGKSNKQIADSLNITEGTVKLHVNKILDKMAVEDRTQAAISAVQRGLIRLD